MSESLSRNRDPHHHAAAPGTACRSAAGRPAAQAERALMQPFIRACGPWQPSFAAHRIDA